MFGTTGTSVARLFSDEDVEEKDDPSPIRLSPSLWSRLSDIATRETERAKASNPHAKVISRNTVIKKVLTDFADKYDADEAMHEKKSKRGH